MSELDFRIFSLVQTQNQSLMRFPRGQWLCGDELGFIFHPSKNGKNYSHSSQSPEAMRAKRSPFINIHKFDFSPKHNKSSDIINHFLSLGTFFFSPGEEIMDSITRNYDDFYGNEIDAAPK